MVSSKCAQVESPSPLRFLAALIPPCAQTECERFTGTMENRSTCPPISAILITAARPARPPPITVILGAVILLVFQSVYGGGERDLSRAGRLDRRSQERIHGHRTHAHEQQSYCQADVTKAAARLITGRDAPLGREQPQAVSEVPGSAHNTH